MAEGHRVTTSLHRFFLTPAVVLFFILFFCFTLSSQPFVTLRCILLGPIQNRYFFGNMLNESIPLIFGGIAVTIAILSGNFNLGGEGQIYCGAFVSTLSAIAFSESGWIGAVFALTLGMMAAGVLSGFSGWLKQKWGANELITSFLAANIVVLIINQLITGPFQDPNASTLTTQKIPESIRLTKIMPPSQLNTGLFIALAFAGLTAIFISFTRTGYELRLCGKNSRFAAYAGINTNFFTILSMTLSGMLYGLGGGMMIFGTYYGCIKEFHSGIGFNGIAVALIARQNPLGVIPAAILFAWINTGSKIAMQQSDVTLEIASVIQASIFLFITSEVLRKPKRRKQ